MVKLQLSPYVTRATKFPLAYLPWRQEESCHYLFVHWSNGLSAIYKILVGCVLAILAVRERWTFRV